MNIGICFNCEWRNNGTATYMLRAARIMKDAGGIEDFRHYQNRDPVGKHDFYLAVDDGRDDLSWIPPKPNAYWAVDTHLGYECRLWKAGHFDRVFVAQKDAVRKFRRDGIPHVSWLPLACWPEAHPNAAELAALGADVSEKWDIAFVGFMQDDNGDGRNNRTDHLDRLFREFPNSRLSVNVFFEAMALRYVKARLGFNVSIARDLNMRVFEIMSTGTPLLTNRNVEGIGDLFEEGSDYHGYEGVREMIDAAHSALNDPERKALAEAACGKVRSDHTYIRRLETILEEMRHV